MIGGSGKLRQEASTNGLGEAADTCPRTLAESSPCVTVKARYECNDDEGCDGHLQHPLPRLGQVHRGTVEEIVLRHGACRRPAHGPPTVSPQPHRHLAIQHRLSVLAVLDQHADIHRAGAQRRRRRKYRDDEWSYRLVQLHEATVGVCGHDLRHQCHYQEQRAPHPRPACIMVHRALPRTWHQRLPLCTSWHASSRASASVGLRSTRPLRGVQGRDHPAAPMRGMESRAQEASGPALRRRFRSAVAVEAPTAPETGRTATRGPCSTWMVMQAAGIRKATEPSTHMIAPAAAWSSSAVIAVSRGAVAYVG